MSEENHEEYQVCYKHPDRKTLLRCNKCDRPICLECAVLTPTGYRCKECVKTQQKVFDTAEPKDYLIAAAVAFAIGFAGSYAEQLLSLLSSLLSALIFGILAGKLVCAAVRAAVSRRRSRMLSIVTVAAAGLGGLVQRLQAIRIILTYFVGSGMVSGGLMQILMNLLYIFVLCFTVWSEMNGMVFRR